MFFLIVACKLWPEHPEVGTTYNNMANVALAQADYAQATELYFKALGIQEKALGPTHPSVGSTYGNLCLVYWRQGKREEAVAMHRKLAATQLGVEGYASGVAFDAGAPTRSLAALLEPEACMVQVSPRRLWR